MTFSTSNPRAKSRWLVLVAAVAAMTILAGSVVLANHGDVSLDGSHFEIDTDANLTVEHGSPSIDWASVAEDRETDQPSGTDDNSFGQGSKEDTAVPTVVSGSIPPNKSDLKDFGVYVEENANGKFLHLFWTRVQDPSGTTNMDFEFNQSDTLSANGVTPVRMPGDLLITYDLSKGGTVPVLSMREWSGSAWGTETDLSATGAATGSINTTAISADHSDGLGPLSPRTFGEASIDLALVFDPDSCDSFGSAYLKSRSSDSFTAALKDFIAPEPVNISNCGSVIIRKETLPDESANSTTFGFTSNLVTDPVNEDLDVQDFDLTDDGSESISNVVAGEDYTVTEDDPASDGYALTGIDCSESDDEATFAVDLTTRTATFDVAVGETIDCTFTNSRLPKLELIKNVTNDNGGTAVATDWTLSAAGDSGGFSNHALTAIAAGDYNSRATTGEKTVTASVQYTLSESATPSGYSASAWTCTGGGTFDAPDKITVALGDDVTCEITNDDNKNAPAGSTTMRWVLHDSASYVIRTGASDASSATITFRLYSDASCATEVILGGEERPVTLNEAGTEASASTVTGYPTTTTGTWYWRTFYSGDAFNNAASTACDLEITTISASGS